MDARRFDDVNWLFWRVLRVAMIVVAAYSAVLWLASDSVLGVYAWRWRTRRWESMGIAHFKLRPAEALVASKLPGEP